MDSNTLNQRLYKIIGVAIAPEINNNNSAIYLLTNNAQVLILQQKGNEWILVSREKFSLKYRPVEIDSYFNKDGKQATHLVLRFSNDKKIIHYIPNLSTKTPYKDPFLLNDMFDRFKNLFNVEK